MKKNAFILTLLAVLLAMAANAQPKENRKEKMEELKKSFIKDKLALTEAEGVKFWPIYDEYEEKRKAIRKYMRQNHERIEEGNMTEAEMQKNIADVTAKRIEEAQLDSKFLNDCMPILGVKRVGELILLEDEFRKKLMAELKQRKNGTPPPPPGRE